MLITKFNKLIRSKLLLGFFAVVVAVVFVFAFSPGLNRDQKGKTGDTVGILFGEDISAREFWNARFYALGMRDIDNADPETDKLIKKQTWQRLVALKTAERMGITVKDKEVVEVIQNNPYFSEQGIFNELKYKDYVNRVRRTTIPAFEEFIHQELTFQKLLMMLETAVWVSPFELHEKIKDLTDSFTIQYVLLKSDDHVKKVKVSQKDVREFFEENKEYFTVPDTINVRYVEIPISDYLSKVEIEENELLDYYSEHLEEYSTINTNDESLTTPFEEVREEIIDMVQYQHALYNANNKAAEFVKRLMPDRYGNALDFDKVAYNLNFAIHTSDFFSASEEVPKLEVGPDFVATAFSLDPDDPDRYFSDPLVGSNSVYVIAAGEKKKAHIPDFDEVKDDVMPFVKQKAESEAFTEKINEMQKALTESLQAEKSFEDSLHKIKLNVTTTVTFTAYEAWTQEMEYYNEIIPNIITHGKGELAEITMIEDGALLAFVQDRQPGDASTKEFIRPEFASTLSKYRAELMLAGWNDYMLDQAEFKDLTEKSDESELDAEAAEDDEE
ncbi:SurA N-terminal domain-containing protein [Verrucomicrobiota bacterium]